MTKNRYNLYIIAISIGMGMIPVASDKFFSRLPHALEPLLHSGILLASITAVLLNAHFNGLRSEAEASALAQEAGKQADTAPV
jgi:uric acid transporter